MKSITRQFLTEHHACREERIKFKKVFGDKARFTIKNAKLAADAHMSAYWLRNRALDKKQRTKFDMASEKLCNRCDCLTSLDYENSYWAAMCVALGLAKLKRNKKIGFDAIGAV